MHMHFSPLRKPARRNGSNTASALFESEEEGADVVTGIHGDSRQAEVDTVSLRHSAFFRVVLCERTAERGPFVREE